jgi:hypothetical protein
MEPVWLRRTALPLVALVVMPIVLIGLAAGGLGVVGLGGYLVAFFLLVVWDLFATWRAVSNRVDRTSDLLAPLNLVVVAAYGLVFVTWGPGIIYMWGSGRTLWAVAYAVAAVLTLYQLWRAPATRRFRHYLFAVFNVLGAMAVGAWALADGGSPGVWPLTAAAQGWGITQALLYMWGAYFAPIFFLPPLLVFEPKVVRADDEDQQVSVDPGSGVVRIAGGEALEAAAPSMDGTSTAPVGRRRGPLRRVVSLTFDMLLGGLVVFLLVFNVVGAINLASWNDLPDPGDAKYGRSEDFQFAAMGRAFTDRREAVGDWRDVVDQEVYHARELGLDLVRYDLHREFLDDPLQISRLEAGVAEVRAAGLDVILSPFGSARWEGDPPSFDELVVEIQRETYLLVELFEPAWVFPFFEPNGQVMVNLGDFAPVEDWLEVINETGTHVRQLSNRTRVLIEVAIEPVQGLDLVRGLSRPGMAIDAIGVDLYPLSAGDLDKLDPYREAATNDQLGFWLGEFGVESLMSGHKGQARALSEVLVRATDGLDADGICVWSLLDDTVLPSNLGMVGRGGDAKEAYWVLREAIERIRSG